MTVQELRNEARAWLGKIARTKQWLVEQMDVRLSAHGRPYTINTLKKYVSNFFNPDLEWTPQDGERSPFVRALRDVMEAQKDGTLHRGREVPWMRAVESGADSGDAADAAASALLPQLAQETARDLVRMHGGAVALRYDQIIFGLACSDSPLEDQVRLACLWFYLECPNRVMEQVVAGDAVAIELRHVARGIRRVRTIVRRARSGRCKRPTGPRIDARLRFRAALAELLLVGVSTRLHGEVPISPAELNAALDELRSSLAVPAASSSEKTRSTYVKEAGFALAACAQLAELLPCEPLVVAMAEALARAARDWPSALLTEIRATRDFTALDRIWREQQLLEPEASTAQRSSVSA